MMGKKKEKRKRWVGWGSKVWIEGRAEGGAEVMVRSIKPQARIDLRTTATAESGRGGKETWILLTVKA